MHAETPQLAFSRVFDAPRALVFRAFADPAQFATWWKPSGNSPAHLAGPSNQGWLEAFEKLDATLLHLQAATADIEV